MCDASERNTRAVFAIEQMMGAWCLDLGTIKSILTGTDCRHEPEGKVCKYCTGIGYHHEWCTRPRDNKRPPKPTEPVPHEYCDGGSCWRLANRWEYAARYNDWIAVCDEHGDKIKASSTT